MARVAAALALCAAVAAVGEAAHLKMSVYHVSTGAGQATAASTDASGAGTVSASSATASTASSGAASSTSTSTNGEWHMKTVKSVQARVQGDKPAWDATAERWLASFYDTTELNYRAVLDTVNTASVEGALMYVQAEGINVEEQSVKCQRKNGMQYVVFYEMTIVQPNASLKYYESHSPYEYGQFVAMDTSACTNSGSDLPETCKVYFGLDGYKDLGPAVGANEQSSDPRAPYPGNYWFSYPGSCAQKPRGDEKTDACREEYPGGLCALGVEPDGVNCTFSYTILGYIDIDDLVGITSMTSTSGATYANYSEFCEDGGIEFSATNTGSGFSDVTSISFWENPGDKDANANRTTYMVELYNSLVESYAGSGDDSGATMTALPSLSTLVSENPPCYENSATCASSPNGCSRSLYAQVCLECDTAGDGCETAPSGFKFPTLTLPEGTSAAFSESGSSSVDAGRDGSDGTDGADGSDKKSGSNHASAASLVSSVVALAAVAAAAML